MTVYATITKPQLRRDAWLKAAGTAQYAADFLMAGMLTAKVLRSPHPHARILRIDTSRAEALPGVVAVTTADDLPRVMTGRWLKDRTVFAWDRVRYIGQPVAAVAAVDEETAEEALELIQVDYEPLPSVFDPEEALQPGAPLVHEEAASYQPTNRPCRGNIHQEHRVERGDVDAAFAQADVVYEARYTTPFVHHGFVQPHQTVAAVDATGKLTLWTSTKDPYSERKMLAEVLQLPMSRLRVIPGYVGGDFGGKGTISIEPICASLALKARRPVGLSLTWQEELGTTFIRARTVIRLKAAAKKDGTLLALQAWELHDSGSHMDSVAGDLGYSCDYLHGPYRWPNLDLKITMVYTNNTPTGHCRGVRVPAEQFAIESHMDGLARKLGLDPVEMRLKNIVEDGYVMGSGATVRNVGVRPALEALASYLKRERGARQPNTGWGISLSQYGLHPLPSGVQSTSACVKINEDGTAVLLTGSTEQGSGIHTVLQQIVAEVLALPLEQVSVVAHDTDATPWERGTGASQTVYREGQSVRMAAEDAREQLLALAAERLKVDPGDLALGEGKVFVRDAPEMWLPVAQVATSALTSRYGPIMGTGHRLRQDHFARMEADHGVIDGPAYGGNAVQVEVDPETGKVKVLKYYIGWEVGRAINPSNVEGQLQGGAVFGLGYALTEEMVVKEGRVLNNNLLDFRLSTACDAPRVEARIMEEAPSTWGPYGAKGMAEGANAPVAAAVANAVHEAVGVRVLDLPLNPERVFTALKAQQG